MKLKYNNSKTFNSSTLEGAIRNELKGLKGSIEEILDGQAIDSDEFDDFADNITDSIEFILHNLRKFNAEVISRDIDESDETEDD